MSDELSPLQRAIDRAGSEAKLAAVLGVSQPAINKAKTADRVSLRIAAGLARHFDIPLHVSRPDAFDPPASEQTEAA